MDILTTIIPIFTIIILGWLAQRKGFLPPEFLNPANRLVYFIAIPALIFNAISQTTISRQLNPPVIVLMLVAAIGAYAVAWLAAKGMGLPLSQRGTYVQCAGHGNLGYIGLAVAYYFLGDDGLTRAGVAAGFLMILQNLMSVMVLQAYSFADGPTNPMVTDDCKGIRKSGYSIRHGRHSFFH